MGPDPSLTLSRCELPSTFLGICVLTCRVGIRTAPPKPWAGLHTMMRVRCLIQCPVHGRFSIEGRGGFSASPATASKQRRGHQKCPSTLLRILLRTSHGAGVCSSPFHLRKIGDMFIDVIPGISVTFRCLHQPTCWSSYPVFLLSLGTSLAMGGSTTHEKFGFTKQGHVSSWLTVGNWNLRR